MRSRLRLFALVGTIATLIDFFLLLLLQNWSLFFGNIIALVVAAFTAYFFNRAFTFKGSETARWVSSPGLFAVTAFLAGAVDMLILFSFKEIFNSIILAKIIAIASGALVRWLAYRWILFSAIRKEMSSRVGRPDPSGDHRLSVVIPAYNEGERIAETVSVIDEALSAANLGSFEIVVVDDGSKDDTGSIAASAGARVITHEVNQGKGAGVKTGVLESNGKSIVFTDADLAYPPSMILVVLEEIEKGWDVVVGSRRHRGTHTVVKAKKLREIGGWCINKFTHLVLLGNFRDTQCGIKGFQSDIGKVIFERSKTKGFAFDVEIFLMAEQDHLSLKEIPVFVENRAESSVNLFKDTFILFSDLFRMRRWVGSGIYEPTPEQKSLLSRRK